MQIQRTQPRDLSNQTQAHPKGLQILLDLLLQTGFTWHTFPHGRLAQRRETIKESVLRLASELPHKDDFRYFFTPAGVCQVSARWESEPSERPGRSSKMFNSVYYRDDPSKEFVTFRWIDNGAVTMVSSVHESTEKC